MQYHIYPNIFYIAKTIFSARKAPKSDRKATKSGRKNPVFVFMNFFEFLNFETEKSEIGPENTFRVAPETENFPKNRIFRPENFSLRETATCLQLIFYLVYAPIRNMTLKKQREYIRVGFLSQKKKIRVGFILR